MEKNDPQVRVAFQTTVHTKAASIFNTIRSWFRSKSPSPDDSGERPQSTAARVDLMELFTDGGPTSTEHSENLFSSGMNSQSWLEEPCVEAPDDQARDETEEEQEEHDVHDEHEGAGHNGHEEGEEASHNDDQKDQRWKAPSIEAAKIAHAELKNILHPPRKNGIGYKHANIDLLLRSRLEAMQQYLWIYINPCSRYHGKWMAASIETAQSLARGLWFVRRLWQWTCTFIEDAETLPLNIYGTWNKSTLDDEDLQQEIFTHLQSVGKYVCAADLVRFMEQPDVQKCFRMKKGISEHTARYWMNRLGYRWTLEPSGQYVDGHEREDVDDYRQKVFLPRWMELEPRVRAWTLDGTAEVEGVVEFCDNALWHAIRCQFSPELKRHIVRGFCTYVLKCGLDDF
jgi:hypothetical protein